MQTQMVPVGMPRIPRNIINGVFYLYRDAADAAAGRNPGGTGFIVKYDGAWGEVWGAYEDGDHYYGVTNWHVACRDGFSTVRINTHEGPPDVIEFGPEEWHFRPGLNDVAIVPLTLDGRIHDIAATSTKMFARRDDNFDIGVGEDTFMIGLFIDHHGTSKNVPSARFGNISMMPNEAAAIKQPTGYRGVGYVVDMHSRPGFSGSPVFAYRTFGSELGEVYETRYQKLEDLTLEKDPTGRFRGEMRVPSQIRLLGIHWGQFTERWELKNRELSEAHRMELVKDGSSFVEGVSGMTCVVPAWEIWEMLEMRENKRPRDALIAQRRAAHLAKYRAVPKAESAGATSPPANDANPNHQEDFMRLVGAAARKPPQED